MPRPPSATLRIPLSVLVGRSVGRSVEPLFSIPRIQPRLTHAIGFRPHARPNRTVTVARSFWLVARGFVLASSNGVIVAKPSLAAYTVSYHRSRAFVTPDSWKRMTRSVDFIIFVVEWSISRKPKRRPRSDPSHRCFRISRPRSPRDSVPSTERKFEDEKS